MQDKKSDIGICDRFRLTREELRLTQKEFASSLDIKQTAVSKIENGRKQLDPPTMLKLMEVFQISINWILTGTGPKYLYNKTEDSEADSDPEVTELIKGARRVLTSGNLIAFDALERNIRYFDHAIEAERRADEMEKQILEIRKEIVELKRENLRLDKEAEEQSSEKKAI